MGNFPVCHGCYQAFGDRRRRLDRWLDAVLSENG
jgi:hypothetical protein